jgi:hypothetical protein
VRARRSRSSSLRGLRRPFSRVRCVGRTGVGGTVPQGCCWPCCTALHNGVDGLTGEVGGVVPGCDSQARRVVDSSLTQAPANVSALNPPVGEQVWRRQTREVLERDGTSLEGAFNSRSRRDPLEGASSPRARCNLTRGGAQPPSEAEPHPRGRPALERGGVLPMRHRAPRAKRSSARGLLGRLSGRLWSRGFILRVFLGSFVFVFYEGKRVFPGVV